MVLECIHFKRPKTSINFYICNIISKEVQLLHFFDSLKPTVKNLFKILSKTVKKHQKLRLKFFSWLYRNNNQRRKKDICKYQIISAHTNLRYLDTTKVTDTVIWVPRFE